MNPAAQGPASGGAAPAPQGFRGNRRPRVEVARVAVAVVLMMLAFVAAQVWWEGRTEAVFPDHHSADGNDGLRSALDFYDLFGSGRHFTTGRSLCNPVAGAAMALLGPEIRVARLSQVPFILGVVMAMAGIGWHLAGRRGALLLALGATTSPWAFLFVRYYTRVPLSMLAVAATMLLLLRSRSLTRPWTCVGLGLALGLGWLADLIFPLLLAPTVLLAAGSGLFKSRRSVFSVLVLGSALTLLAVLLADLSTAPVRRYPIPDRVLPAVVMDLWVAPLLLSLWATRNRPWTPGTGLAVSVSLAGLVASPFFLNYRELRIMELLTALVEQNSPVLDGFWSLEASLRQYLCWLHAFYWGGYLWLLPGALLLALNRATRRAAVTVGLGLAATLALLAWLLPPVYARYLAPFLPMALIPGFLWAARWRSTYVACLVFMLAVGPVQILGNMPPWSAALGKAGIAGLTYDHPWYHERLPRLDWRIPVVRDPMPTPSVFHRIPPGARIGLVLVQAEDTQMFYQSYLERHFQVVRLLPAPRLELGDLRYVVVVAPRAWSLQGDSRLVRVHGSGEATEPHPSFPSTMVHPRLYLRVLGPRACEAASSGPGRGGRPG